ncbi:MAG TPA: helix-turn-helix domain-containing protein [Candidatus Limnocylindrales bacterium]
MSARRGARAPYPPVVVAHGPAFELVCQLGAFTSGPVRASLEQGKAWIRDVRRLAGPALLARVERYGLGAYGELATLVLEAGRPYGLEQLAERLRATDPAALRRRLSGADSALNRTMVEPQVLEAALDGQRRAQARLIDAFAGNASERRTLRRLLETPPVVIRREMVAIVEGWSRRVFPALSEEPLAAIAREATSRRRMLRARPGREVVLDATSGLDYRPAAWIKRIVLVPVVALRPFMVPTELGSTALFLYPVADDALDSEPDAPPRQLVKRAAALGDPLRLRALAQLRDAALSASELAERLAVDRTSLHHHLGILRSAGLLAIEDLGERGWRYRLRDEGVGAVGSDIEAYLERAARGNR